MLKKVLILGAGLVARPIVKHLLASGYSLTVADIVQSKAAELTGNHPHAEAVALNVEDETSLGNLVSGHDLTVSLLPYVFHVQVARHCIRYRKNMVTTSYVKPEMEALDSEAKEAGIIILNEMGLDPGIDHMSAMRIIDHVHSRNGKVLEFYSICGALPAPEAVDNPFRYKFSWSPKGVVMAGNNDARYLKHGSEVFVPTAELFRHPASVEFKGVGKLDIYPNRDSISYIDIYGIPEVQTMMRGTFRYPGWCETLDAIKQLNLISYDKSDMSGMTYAQLLMHQIGADTADHLRNKVAAYLGVDVNAHALDALEWLGLFENKPMNRGMESPFEVTSDLMIAKMELGYDERDMVAMQHTFLAEYPDGKKEIIRSRMLDFGSPSTDTSIARTVALPAAIGVEMIMKGEITVKGVFRPVIPEIYNPVLDALEKLDIRMEEEYGLPLSENIA
ncbi:MAG: saccharopine dehydrogenase NADP-binding domain-containing protein [Bacteroidales bacterium]|nr:saccharopine dehydrogenase NADP-binding domain-containing protein [Bacteroidales bacterium]MBK9358622.1 saccharopine dehydrogenase NADP-binding domain-containing protein [Bacteroidales bacterium]